MAIIFLVSCINILEILFILKNYLINKINIDKEVNVLLKLMKNTCNIRWNKFNYQFYLLYCAGHNKVNLVLLFYLNIKVLLDM